MSVLTVRAKLKEEHVADAEAAAKRMFAAIERERLEGIRYASVKLEDGVTFLALLEVDDGVEHLGHRGAGSAHGASRRLRGRVAGPCRRSRRAPRGA
jgi:hypothetical protein